MRKAKSNPFRDRCYANKTNSLAVCAGCPNEIKSNLSYAENFPFFLSKTLRDVARNEDQSACTCRLANMEIIPPINSPKPHSSTNFDSKNFLSFYSSEIEEKAAPQ